MDLTHDCSICKKASNCPLEHLAPAINEHSTSIREAVEREKKLMASMLASMAETSPELLICKKAATEVALTAFVIGYATALS